MFRTLDNNEVGNEENFLKIALQRAALKVFHRYRFARGERDFISCINLGNTRRDPHLAGLHREFYVRGVDTRRVYCGEDNARVRGFGSVVLVGPVVAKAIDLGFLVPAEKARTVDRRRLSIGADGREAAR